MLGDEVDDRLRQAILLSQRDAVLDVADDDQRAEGRLEIVVAILAGLVFDEVLRLEHLADVMEIAADADQKRVGADRLGRRLGERGDGDAVRVGSRRPLDELLQKRMRAVGQFQAG